MQVLLSAHILLNCKKNKNKVKKMAPQNEHRLNKTELEPLHTWETTQV